MDTVVKYHVYRDFTTPIFLEGVFGDEKNRAGGFSVTRDMKLVIAGKEPLASALKLLFEEDGYFNKVEIYYPTQEKPMSGYGLYQIAKANS